MANVENLTNSQLENAKLIYNVGVQRKASQRDIITALMVAFDESGFQNLANSNVPASLSIPHDGVGSDHASVGIFQQQVGIWGTAQELMNPTIAANKFYDKLSTVDETGKSLPQVAQEVQGSATPDGSNYAAFLSKATNLWIAISSGTAGTGGGLNPDKGATPTLPSVASPLVDALKWLSTPENWQRIGLFVLGAILLIVVVVNLVGETDAAKTAVKVAGKIV